MFSVSIAGQDSRECVCHRRHPGHTDELHSLCVFLGHHCPESWIQAFLWQEGQFRFWWGKFLKEICYLLLICFLYAFVMVGFFVWFFFFNLFYVSVPRLRYLEQTDCCNMLLTVRVLSALICFSMGGRDSLKLIEVLSRYNSLWLFVFGFFSQIYWQWVKQLMNHHRKRATPLILHATLPWKQLTSTITSPSSVWGW